MSYGKMIVVNVLGCCLWSVLCDRLELSSILLYGGMGVFLMATTTLSLVRDAAANRAIEELEAEMETEERIA